MPVVGYDQPSIGAFLGDYCTTYIGWALLITVAVSIALLALFILHSVTLWISTDPEVAFHRARQWAGYYSSAWNSVRTLYNGGKKVAFFWIPSWNMLAKHAIEPTIYIGLDIMSQIFAGHHYEGVITDSTSAGGVPFRGHYCGLPIRNARGEISGYNSVDDTTSKWCSYQSQEAWSNGLGMTENEDPANAVVNGTTLLFSTAHARKLQEIFTETEQEGGSMFGSLNLGPLLMAVQEIVGVISLISTTAFDIAAHVAFVVLSELAVLLWNMAQLLVRAVAGAVMALVSSGALQTLLKVGLDLLMTLVFYVALPMLLAVIDIIICIINFIQPGTWPEQLKCVERTCFQESGDIGTLPSFELFPHPPPCPHPSSYNIYDNTTASRSISMALPLRISTYGPLM